MSSRRRFQWRAMDLAGGGAWGRQRRSLVAGGGAWGRRGRRPVRRGATVAP
uniref:Uncharacterized protein n=1 Tax=Arundo donax TaxID=35708 RepID=A0A0A9B9Z3_ARUDO